MEKYRNIIAILFGLAAITALAALVGFFTHLTWNVWEWEAITRFVVGTLWFGGVVWAMDTIE